MVSDEIVLVVLDLVIKVIVDGFNLLVLFEYVLVWLSFEVKVNLCEFVKGILDLDFFSVFFVIEGYMDGIGFVIYN